MPATVLYALHAPPDRETARAKGLITGKQILLRGIAHSHSGMNGQLRTLNMERQYMTIAWQINVDMQDRSLLLAAIGGPALEYG